jgi:hypothetical protein
MQTTGILASKAPGANLEPSPTPDIYKVSDYLDLELTSGVWLEEEFKEMESDVYFKSINLRVAMRLIYRKVDLK